MGAKFPHFMTHTLSTTIPPSSHRESNECIENVSYKLSSSAASERPHSERLGYAQLKKISTVHSTRNYYLYITTMLQKYL